MCVAPTLAKADICDLSSENVQQRFSVEQLKPLEKPLAFFLYPLKALKKAVGQFLPNRWKSWKKPLGSFPLPVESAEKSRWKNSSYPLLQRRKA